MYIHQVSMSKHAHMYIRMYFKYMNSIVLKNEYNTPGHVPKAQCISSLIKCVVFSGISCVGGIVHTAAVPSVCRIMLHDHNVENM